jgi:hypothetical protein
MADPNHLRILKQGAKAFNGWRAKNPDIVSNLVKANLSGADLSGAILEDADLRQAIFANTIFTSRTVLTLLRRALTDEQKSAIIFSDEIEMAQKKSVADKLQNYQSLTIEFQNQVSWKNEWLALLLLAIQTTYNNCFYLISTKEEDIEIIKSNRRKKFAFAINQTDYISEIIGDIKKELDHLSLPSANDVVLRATGKLLFLASKNLLIVLGTLKETANIGDMLVKMDNG